MFRATLHYTTLFLHGRNSVVKCRKKPGATANRPRSKCGYNFRQIRSVVMAGEMLWLRFRGILTSAAGRRLQVTARLPHECQAQAHYTLSRHLNLRARTFRHPT